MGRVVSRVTSALCLAAALVVGTTADVSGQEAAVRAAVDQIFAGMRTADAAMVRAVFASEARFAIIDSRNGPATIHGQAVDGWINAVGGSEGKWDERVYDVQVQVDGDMASVWAPYTFYREGSISHCGINSIEMLRDADGWKVTQLSDTRKQGDCPDPLR